MAAAPEKLPADKTGANRRSVKRVAIPASRTPLSLASEWGCVGVGVGVFPEREVSTLVSPSLRLAWRFPSQEKDQGAIRHYGQALSALVCRFVGVGSGAWQCPSTDVNKQHF